MPIQYPKEIHKILGDVGAIALVGASEKSHRHSHEVMAKENPPGYSPGGRLTYSLMSGSVIFGKKVTRCCTN